jgi:hypothetical protein
MVKKKIGKKVVAKKKVTGAASRPKTVASKAAPKKALKVVASKVASKKAAKAPVAAAAKTVKAAPAKSARRTRVGAGLRGSAGPAGPVALRGRGLGADSGGQSGDIEGLSGAAEADSESVEELAEEGSDFEAGIVQGVEDAPDADEGEVHTREVLEDDVPEEYDDQDQ